MAAYITKTHLENFTGKLLTNDKKIYDELKDDIGNIASGGKNILFADTVADIKDLPLYDGAVGDVLLLNSQLNVALFAKGGYNLSNSDIVCTMGGKEITVTGNRVKTKVTGDIVITATAKQIFNVTNNLTNCVNSNADSTVIEGSTYNATITAKDGYTLDTVTCTMGGVDQTVTDGVINISNVTGNIVITATATPSQP